MKRRCSDSNYNGWKRYGGRGIKVCDRWLEPGGKGFWNFVTDIGERPDGKNGKIAKYSIDRIDNNGDYAPGNCRWATMKQQRANMRARDCAIIRDGDKEITTQVCRERGIPYKLFHNRIHKLGWSIEDALKTPVYGTHKRIEYNGETMTIREWAEKFGVPDWQIRNRLRAGYDMRDAVRRGRIIEAGSKKAYKEKMEEENFDEQVNGSAKELEK
jgi:hypothetical protein